MSTRKENDKEEVKEAIQPVASGSGVAAAE
jgi:hypothetical protein